VAARTATGPGLLVAFIGLRNVPVLRRG
jgi:hypothetical protein